MFAIASVYIAFFACIAIFQVKGCPYLESLKNKAADNVESSSKINNPHLRSLLFTSENLRADPVPVIYTGSAQVCLAYNTLKTNYIANLPSNELGRSNLIGKIVRLTFHDSAEFNQNTEDKLGMDGCLSTHFLNGGLHATDNPEMVAIEDLYAGVKDLLGKADFIALLGKISIELSSGVSSMNIPFHYGRKDNLQCSPSDIVGPNPRLPFTQNPQIEVQRVFVDQMGMTLTNFVTLIGGHTVGHVHTTASGYGVTNVKLTNAKNNAFDKTPAIFDNEYYKGLRRNTWMNNITIAGKRNQWKPNNTLSFVTIFTNADMFATFPIDRTGNSSVGIQNQICNFKNVKNVQTFACKNPKNTTVLDASQVNTYASLAAQVLLYADSNDAFLTSFAAAYSKMTTRGYSGNGIELTAINPGKLGELTLIDFTTDCAPSSAPSASPSEDSNNLPIAV